MQQERSARALLLRSLIRNTEKRELYQELFYLLQTDPVRYLTPLLADDLTPSEEPSSDDGAQTPTESPAKWRPRLLSIIGHSLYGNDFSSLSEETSREEYLLLVLIHSVMQTELPRLRSVGELLQGDWSIVPKMLDLYKSRREPLEYLRRVIGPLVLGIVAESGSDLDSDSDSDSDSNSDSNSTNTPSSTSSSTSEHILNLELNPLRIFEEIKDELNSNGNGNGNGNGNDGDGSDRETSNSSVVVAPPPADENAAMALPRVQKVVEHRLRTLLTICQTFLGAILGSLAQLPYGIRWLCKQFRELSSTNENKREEFHRMIGYFIYYNFINMAIVNPDQPSLRIVNTLSNAARANLAMISRVLSSLFQGTKVTLPSQSIAGPINQWLASKREDVSEYLHSVSRGEEVAQDPDERLRVRNARFHVDLVRKAPPTMMISLGDIAFVHAIFHHYIRPILTAKGLAAGSSSAGPDPVAAVIAQLGDPPMPLEEDPRDEDLQEIHVEEETRVVQLTLIRRFLPRDSSPSEGDDGTKNKEDLPKDEQQSMEESEEGKASRGEQYRVVPLASPSVTEEDMAENEILMISTMRLVVSVLQATPTERISQGIASITLADILEGSIDYACEEHNAQLLNKVNTIYDNLSALEKLGMVKKSDKHQDLVKRVGQYVASYDARRSANLRELEELTRVLNELREHSAYLQDKIARYRDYLSQCKEHPQSLEKELKARQRMWQAHKKLRKQLKRQLKKQAKMLKRKAEQAMGNNNTQPTEGVLPTTDSTISTASVSAKKLKPIKFTFAQLLKKMVIALPSASDNDVLDSTQRKTTLAFTQDEEHPSSIHVFTQVGKNPSTCSIVELDELLERLALHIPTIELDQVSLNVAPTLRLLNKLFFF